jgi:hypothetical protein
MFKRVVGRAKCLFGVHQRSHRLTVYRGDGDTSACRYCATAMKNSPRGWIAAHK